MQGWWPSVVGLAVAVATLGCGDEGPAALADPVPAPLPPAAPAVRQVVPGRTYVTVSGRGVAALSGGPVALTYLDPDRRELVQPCLAELGGSDLTTRSIRFACGVGQPAAVPAGAMTITLENPIERTGMELAVADL